MTTPDKFDNFNNLIKHKWQSNEMKVKFQEKEGCFSYKINEEKEEEFCYTKYTIESGENFLVIRDNFNYENVIVRIEYKPPTSIVFGLFKKNSIELEMCD